MSDVYEKQANELTTTRSIGVAGALSLTILLDTTAQLTWKGAVTQVENASGVGEFLLAFLHQPLFLALIVLFVAMFLNWMLVLSRADLSYVQPITALSYVTSSFASTYLFNDHLPPVRILGICLIILGVWIVGSTHQERPCLSEC